MARAIAVKAFVKLRGQDAYRESTATEKAAWVKKAVQAAEAREARRRQRMIDRLLKEA
jgi:hypothetical protein